MPRKSIEIDAKNSRLRSRRPAPWTARPLFGPDEDLRSAPAFEIENEARTVPLEILERDAIAIVVEQLDKNPVAPAKRPAYPVRVRPQ